MGVLIEGAFLVFADSDSDQVAQDIVTFCRRVQGLTGNELLRDLTFKLNAGTAVPCRGFHSAKLPANLVNSSIRPVHPQGVLQSGGNFEMPIDRAMSPIAVACDVCEYPAALVRQVNLLNMAMPDFAMNEAPAGQENLMQASARGAKGRPIGTMKLIEMEYDQFVSIRILQIADKPAPHADALFTARLLGVEKCRANR